MKWTALFIIITILILSIIAEVNAMKSFLKGLMTTLRDLNEQEKKALESLSILFEPKKDFSDIDKINCVDLVYLEKTFVENRSLSSQRLNEILTNYQKDMDLYLRLKKETDQEMQSVIERADSTEKNTVKFKNLIKEYRKTSLNYQMIAEKVQTQMQQYQKLNIIIDQQEYLLAAAKKATKRNCPNKTVLNELKQLTRRHRQDIF